MQFYPADWIQDTQILTLESQGAWIAILCQLWISETPGERTWNRHSFEVLLHYEGRNSEHGQSIENTLADLDRVGEVYLRDGDGNVAEQYENATWVTIKSRRILRDIEKLSKRKDKNKKYYDKTKTKLRLDSDQIKTQFSEIKTGRSQKSEVRIKNKNEERKKLRPDSDSIKTDGDDDIFLEKKDDDIDPKIKAVAEPIFKVNPKKYARLVMWISAAGKAHRPDVVRLALERFIPYAPTVSDTWWPYLDKILDKTEKDLSFADHEAEHNRLKKEMKKPNPNLSVTDLVKFTDKTGH